MSVYATSYVWEHSKLAGTELLLLLALADQANDEGVCWPGRASLAHKTRLSERSLQKLVPKVLASGELVLLKEAHGTQSRVYRVVCPPRVHAQKRRGEHPSPLGDRNGQLGEKNGAARGELGALGENSGALGENFGASRGEHVFSQTGKNRLIEPSLKPCEPAARVRAREDSEIQPASGPCCSTCQSSFPDLAAYRDHWASCPGLVTD